MNLRPLVRTTRVEVGTDLVAAAISWVGFGGERSWSGRALRRIAIGVLSVFALGFVWGALRVMIRAAEIAN